MAPSTATEFLEFYWADWLRKQPVSDLSKIDTGDTTACLAAISTASQAMAALKATDIVTPAYPLRTEGGCACRRSTLA